MLLQRAFCTLFACLLNVHPILAEVLVGNDSCIGSCVGGTSESLSSAFTCPIFPPASYICETTLSDNHTSPPDVEAVPAGTAKSLTNSIGKKIRSIIFLRLSSHPGIPNPVVMKAPEMSLKTTSTGISSVVHPEVFCDGVHCGKSKIEEGHFIHGIRFRCTVCENINFCERCAASANDRHDKRHPLLKMVLPEEGEPLVFLVGSLDGRLGQLVNVLNTCDGVSLSEFWEYYLLADKTKQSVLLHAFHSLDDSGQVPFLKYFMELDGTKKSEFLEQYQGLHENERQGYLRILIGIERVFSSTHPMISEIPREEFDKMSGGVMGNLRTIGGHFVGTLEAIPKDLAKRSIRQKSLIYHGPSGTPIEPFLGLMKRYRYPQDDGLRELWWAGKMGTRVLDLYPGQGDDQLNCSLRTVWWQTSEDIPEYEALSYTWKEASQDRKLLPSIETDLNTITRNLFEVVHPIFCDGGYLEIGTGLRDALLQLRDPIRKRTLWADQICIDQSNHGERAYHVQLMRYIYRFAKRVIVWTGDEDEHTEGAYTLMETVSRRSKFLPTPTELAEDASITIPPLGSPDWFSLFKFLGRPVFTRAWVVQEIALGRDVIVKCGRYEIDFRKVSGAAAMVNEPTWLLASWRRESLVTEPRLLTSVIGYIRGILGGPQKLSLHQLLFETHSFGVTDKRDKVYALLGLVESMRSETESAVSPTYPIHPDYNKLERDVYMETAKAIILHDGTLDFCGRAGLNRLSSPQLYAKSLPSWVPDFADSESSVMLEAGICPEYRASGDVKAMATWPFEERPDVMALSAYSVDVISQVAQFTTNDEEYRWLGEWSKIASSLGEQYLTGESTVSAFWRTCTAIKIPITPGISPQDLFLSFALRFWVHAEREKPRRDKDLNMFDKLLSFALRFMGYADMENTRWDEDTDLFDNLLAKRIIYDVKEQVSRLKVTMNETSLWEKLSDESGYFAMLVTCSGRRLFVTKKGYIGIGPEGTEPGHKIFVLSGARLPFLLSRAKEPPGIELDGPAYNMVGASYVHGIENGEVLREGGFRWKGIYIY